MSTQTQDPTHIAGLQAQGFLPKSANTPDPTGVCQYCGSPAEPSHPCWRCTGNLKLGYVWDEPNLTWRLGVPDNSKQIWEDLCPSAYKETKTTHSGFPASIYETKVATWKFGRKGLLLFGSTGSGKTRSLFLLLERLVLKEKRNVKVFFSGAWSDFVADNCLGDEDAMHAKRSLAKCDILVFDDLMAETMSQRAEGVLLDTIDMRLREAKPIFATTMYTGKMLTESKKIHDLQRCLALLRRLTEACETVNFAVKK